MTSSPYDPYELGYTRATMVMTKRCNEVIRSKSQKNYRSTDCGLQFVHMKMESLVIVDQHATVNLCQGLVHTARHVPGISLT